MCSWWAALCMAVLVAGCGGTPSPTAETPVASFSGSPAGPSNAVSPSPSPLSAPSPSPTPPDLALPDSPLRVLPAGTPWSTFGSRALETASGDTSTAGWTLTLSDLATGRTVTLATLPAHHEVAGAVLTADRVVWVETWRDLTTPSTGDASPIVTTAISRYATVPGCVDAGKPLRWTITSLVVATGRRVVVASGTNVRTAIDGECADVNAPVIAAEGERVAYTVEAASRDHPVANRIVVRSLDDGHEVRTITSAGLVRDLGLAGQTIVYRDNTVLDPGGATVDPWDGRLMVVSDDGAAPTLLDDHVRAVGIGGGRVGWSRTDAADGSVWTVSLGSGTTAHLTGLATSGFVPDLVSQIAVSTDLVAWVVWGRIGDLGTSRLAVWRRGNESPQFVAGFAQPDYVGISAGWLVWDATLGDPNGKPAGLYAFPLASLSGP
jgi:hypothetical protein